MLFTQTASKLVEACRAKDEAKERWLTLSRAGDEGQHAARTEFLAADTTFSAAADAVVAEIGKLGAIGLAEPALASLPDELRESFYRVAGTIGIRLAVEPTRHSTLSDLVNAWREAAAILDAATRINQVRVGSEPADFEAALADASQWRNPAAWEKAVFAYRLFLGEVAPEDDLADRMGDATHAVVRHARKVRDRLTEELQEMLEGIIDRGMLSQELMDVEPDVRRCVQEIVHGGLIRQRQTAPQPETRTRPVATLPAAETEGE